MNLVGVALLLFLICPSLSQGAGPVVYPVREVIGFNKPSLAARAPAFSEWLGEAGIPRLTEQFVAEFRKEFGPIAVDGIDGKSKHRTLVASLQLVRASHYTVPKKASRCTEYQLPLTLSLVFTNPATGDVLYSFTDTSYAVVELSDAETPERSRGELHAAIAANYRSLLNTLLRRARQGYNPAEIQAGVARVWHGLFILNKGSKAGIALNDELIDAAGNSIQVNYVTEDYAVAAAQLVTKVVKGQVFSKFSNQSLDKTVKKPKVLTMHDGWGDDQLSAIAGLFDSELSKESAFTLLPVNESLATVLGAIARDTQVGQFETTNRRALPDYLMKFRYAPARVYNIGQEGKFGYEVYEQYLLGELIDKQGRIIYSAVGGDRIEEKNVSGTIFDRNARLEILQKNAVIQLAEKFSKSIRFSKATLPVSAVKGSIVDLKDSAKQLQPGNSVLVFRNIGRVDGVANDEVLVPIWQAEVIETADGLARARLLLPQASELKETEVSGTDVVIVEAITAGTLAPSSTSVTYCSEIPSQAGSIPFDDFPVLSRAFGYLLPYALYDSDLSFFAKVKESVKSGGFRDTLNLGAVSTAGRCLLPVHSVTLNKRQCDNEECEAELQLAVGYRLYVDKEKKGSAASKIKLSVQQIRESSFEPVIQGEVSKNALDLLKSNIAKMRYQ